MTSKTLRNQKFKTFKKSGKEAWNKKSSDILYLELKNITKDFFKISKTQKLPTRTKNLFLIFFNSIYSFFSKLFFIWGLLTWHFYFFIFGFLGIFGVIFEFFKFLKIPFWIIINSDYGLFSELFIWGILL